MGKNLVASNSVQTVLADERSLRVAGGDVETRHPAEPWEHQMSKSDEFRQYAEEAMHWARQSKTEHDRVILIDIARTWTLAATFRERTEERAA
jgi:hypothetical protein